MPALQARLTTTCSAFTIESMLTSFGYSPVMPTMLICLARISGLVAVVFM